MSSCFRKEKLSAARIMVVGCGALGNEVLKNLAMLRPGHITVVDFDHVEEGNLSHSVLFSRADADKGLTKVRAAARKISEMSSATDVGLISGDIAHDVGLGLIKSMDVVIGCVDNRLARYCINRLCMRAGVPWVDGGITMLEGTVRVFIPGKNCYACNLTSAELDKMAHRFSCSGNIRRSVKTGSAPTTPIIASIIGAIQVQEALKIIHKEELDEGKLTSLCGKMFYYDGAHFSVGTADFKAYDRECPVHGLWTPVETGNITVSMTIAEVIAILESALHADDVTIILTNDCFVDSVISKKDNKVFPVMKPGRAVASFIEEDEILGRMPLSGYYQNEHWKIDRSFPWKHLTLKEIGIPVKDILHVSAKGKDHYIEMK